MESGEHKDHTQDEKKPPLPNGDNIKNDAIEKKDSQTPITENETNDKKDTSQPIRTETKNLSESDSNKVIARWTKILGKTTIILSICAIIGIGITIYQIRESENTTTVAFKKMEKAINSLEKSDSINSIALNNSENSFEIENRAFVIADFTSLANMGSYSYYSGNIKNFGRTLAYITYAIYNKELTDSAFSKITINKKILDSTINKTTGYIVLGTGQEYRIISPEYKFVTSFDDRQSGKTKMYAWGNIQYRDFFGKKHYTHFEGVWNWGTGTFTPIGKYNDAN